LGEGEALGQSSPGLASASQPAGALLPASADAPADVLAIIASASALPIAEAGIPTSPMATAVDVPTGASATQWPSASLDGDVLDVLGATPLGLPLCG